MPTGRNASCGNGQHHVIEPCHHHLLSFCHVIISRKALQVFSERQTVDFESRVLAHWKRCFPAECSSFKDEELVKLIQHGSQRGAVHGFKTERDRCKYLDLLLLFGRNFDTDPENEWAIQILNDSTLEDPSDRADQLHEQGLASYI